MIQGDATVELLPAIDLRGGRVVRLRQGDDEQRTEYAVEPGEVLAGYAAAGVRRVHVVDLDAALGNEPQRSLLERLVKSNPVAIQLGGGLRSRESVEWAFEAGFERVVITSLMVRQPPAFAELARHWPERIVAALDLFKGELRTHGWKEGAGHDLDELCETLQTLPLAAVLVTDIERDGTLDGPNVELAQSMAERTGKPSLVSGGVRRLDDLRRARQAAGVSGVIVGRALYDGAFTVEEALSACRGE